MSTSLGKFMNLSIFVIILFHAFDFGAAVVCWDCSSDTDQNCGDPFNMTTLLVTDCSRISQTQQKCKKTKLKVGEHFKYIRGCVMDDELPVPAALEYVCELDACNSATAQLPMMLFVTASPLILGVMLTHCFE